MTSLGVLRRSGFCIFKNITGKAIKGIPVPFTGYEIVTKKTANAFNALYGEGKTRCSFPQNSELPDTPVLDWNPNKSDSNIVKSAQDYRSEISDNIYAHIFRSKLSGQISISSGRSYWRLETMRKIRQSLPEVFRGKIIEIGAGTGIVTSELSKFPEVERIYCMDYDQDTVEKLMPLVQWSLDANIKKITRVIGSYNNIKCEEEFDAIIAVGALHHSEDLDKTLRECFRVLKPGGRFIISDYCLTGTLTQYEYSAMMEKPLDESDAKTVVSGYKSENIRKNSTISEHARPAYIYQAAAFNAGFNIKTYLFDATLDNGGRGTRLFRRMREAVNSDKFYQDMYSERHLGYDKFGNVRAFNMTDKVYYPFYACGAPTAAKLSLLGDIGSRPVYDNMVLVLQKPVFRNIKIPYRYKTGNVYHLPVHDISNNSK